MRHFDRSAKSRHALAWLVMLTFVATPLAAQSPAPSVARCSALMDSVQRAGPPGPPDFHAITSVVKPCVDRIDVDSVPPGELVALARLLRSVGDDRHAGPVIDRRLTDPRLTSAERRQALAVALEIYGNTDTTLVRSRQLVRELDSLESDELDQRIIAHETLVRAASAVDKPDIERAEARTLLELASRAAGRDSLAHVRTYAIRLATESLADLLAVAHHGDAVGALVDSVLQRFTDLPDLPASLEPTRARYALIGHAAPALRADAWLGTGAPVTSWRGPVRVLEFTAHWCAPCRLSYPGLVALARKRAPSDVQIVLATQTYGYFGTDTALAPGEELARDRAMYAHELPIPATIAVERCATRDCDAWHGANQRAYSVKPLPMFYVVDRSGIVRDVWFGWTEASSARLERDVATLLASPAAP